MIGFCQTNVVALGLPMDILIKLNEVANGKNYSA